MVSRAEATGSETSGETLLSVLNRAEVDVAHGVSEITNVEQTFSAKPRSIGPAESFPKGVVWSYDIPMTSRIRDVYGTFRPIVGPLGDLNPHHSRKQQRSNRSEHLIPRRLQYRNGILRISNILGIEPNGIQWHSKPSCRSLLGLQHCLPLGTRMASMTDGRDVSQRCVR